MSSSTPSNPIRAASANTRSHGSLRHPSRVPYRTLLAPFQYEKPLPSSLLHPLIPSISTSPFLTPPEQLNEQRQRMVFHPRQRIQHQPQRRRDRLPDDEPHEERPELPIGPRPQEAIDERDDEPPEQEREPQRRDLPPV